MEVVERKRSRGGFLNLFDWPGKSRKKKLFSSSSSSQLSVEEPKQTKQNAQNLLKKPSLVNYNLRSDSSCCASSVTSDDGQETRAPSVVARLMGLESIPVPNVQEPRFNPDLDIFFFRHSRNTNAYERFQSETLPPPRLAKPISVANNRLLSPIRSPGFVPSRNHLVYVMEAASRMIEPSPPRMVTRTRFSPSDSPSSVPMRIRDLREKLKASSRQVSRKHNEKRAASVTTTPLLMGKSSSEGLKSKAKPPHVSAKAKASTTALSVTRNSASHKEKAEPKKRIVTNQNGLRGQKQNCMDNQRLGKNTSLSLSRKKTLPRGKKPPNGMQECDKRIKRGENVIKCNIAVDGGLHSGKYDHRKEVDVISFTYSSPIKGLSSDSLSSTQVTDQDTDSAVRELTSKVESSSCSLNQEESSSESVVTTLTYSEEEERLDWELEYISEILGSDQLMVREFALGTAADVLPASLFNDLEGHGEAKLKRKTLFDYVNKWLALKCEQMFRGSSCRGILFEHRDWLAEELNREIQRLKKMREMMMDELVEKEMSSLEGSWLDFERESYEEGIDIEGEIVSTLVDDLVNELASVFKEEH